MILWECLCPCKWGWMLYPMALVVHVWVNTPEWSFYPKALVSDTSQLRMREVPFLPLSTLSPTTLTHTPQMPLVLCLFHPCTSIFLFLIVGKLSIHPSYYIYRCICGKYIYFAWFQEAHLRFLLSDSCLSEMFNTGVKITCSRRLVWIAGF